jgi:hypothetical protein
MVGPETVVTFAINKDSNEKVRFYTPEPAPPAAAVAATTTGQDHLSECEVAPVVTTSETIFFCDECGTKTTTRITETVRMLTPKK